MSNVNDGGPAFPCDLPSIGQHGNMPFSIGMTLRDYFAAKAMQGALAGHHAYAGHEDYWPPHGVAAYAYEVADAMLKARQS